MLLREQQIDLPVALDRSSALALIQDATRFRLPSNIVPLRFAITKSGSDRVSCTISTLEALSEPGNAADISIFEFAPRNYEDTNRFSVALLIPTGIGAELVVMRVMRRRLRGWSPRPVTH